jgi:hypothetical protein
MANDLVNVSKRLIGDCNLVTLNSANAAIGRETKFKTIVAADESCFFGNAYDIWLVTVQRYLACTTQTKYSDGKASRFDQFGFPIVSTAYLLFRKDNITIQHSPPLFLFPICKQSFSQEHYERL